MTMSWRGRLRRCGSSRFTFEPGFTPCSTHRVPVLLGHRHDALLVRDQRQRLEPFSATALSTGLGWFPPLVFPLLIRHGLVSDRPAAGVTVFNRAVRQHGLG